MTPSILSARITSGLLVGLALSFTQAGCQRTAEQYVASGNRYFQQGKYADAALNYRKSIQKNPNLAEAHYRLGRAELNLGNQRTAYDELQRGVDLAPERDDIRIELADLALEGYRTSRDKPKRLYDQVVTTSERLLRKNPSSFDGLRLRADGLTLDGKLTDAISVYKQANVVRPLEPGVVFPMIQVLFRLNQTGEAEDLAKKFLQVHKDIGSVYDLLAAQYIRDKRTTEAEAVFKSKVTNMPADPGPLLQLATFYHQQQRPAEMTQTLQRIVSDPKHFPAGHALVGDFQAGIQNPEEA